MTKNTPTKSIRIVVDIPTTSVNNLRTLCDLIGETQSELVTTAIDTYVEQHQDIIDRFIDLRNTLKNNDSFLKK